MPSKGKFVCVDEVCGDRFACLYVPERNEYKHDHPVSIIFSDSKIEPATPQNSKRAQTV
jgi:hypothetical protein